MIELQRIGSYLDVRNLGFNAQDTKYTKLGKVVAGIGVAGLAVISWKLVAIGGAGYSAYKGTQYIQNWFLRKHTVKHEKSKETSQGDVPGANTPLDAGHDAYADSQQKESHTRPVLEHPHVYLKELQSTILTERGKKVLGTIITHPRSVEMGNDISWVAKMVTVHSRWAKRSFGLSLYLVPIFRKIKGCMGGYQEKPRDVASQ